MTFRRLYVWLIQRHPERFRQEFGEQMLSIFDDSMRRRSGLHLVIDGFVSMLRQRLLRPEYRRSEQLRKSAMRANFVWTIGALGLYVVVAWLVHPARTTVTETATFFYPIYLVLLWLALYKAFSPADHLDCLRRWSDYMGPALIIGTLVWPAIGVFFSLLLGRIPGLRSWLSVNFIVFAIQTALFYAFLKPRNERATLALEPELKTTRRSG
jgi:hypothetical protein